MAAFTSGSDWSFDNLAGGFPQTAQYEHVSETTGTEQTPPRQPPSEESRTRSRHWLERQCRICLETVLPTFDVDETNALPQVLQSTPRVRYFSEDGGRLLSPCKCKGSQKYVHEDCLQAWRLADPSRQRNYWECPTCLYRYQLQRLTWGARINSTAAQLVLTLIIFILTTFLLGFVADPIINAWLYDPVYAVTSAAGRTGSVIFKDAEASWAEHFGKGFAGLGFLGVAKTLLSVSPFMRSGFGGAIARPNNGGTGRDRINVIGWLAILFGVFTFLVAVWKGVRAWSRKTLEAAQERVLDVPGDDDDDTHEQ